MVAKTAAAKAVSGQHLPPDTVSSNICHVFSTEVQDLT